MLAKREFFPRRFSSSEFGSADALSAALTPVFGPTVVEPARGSRTFQVQFDIFHSNKMAIGRTTFKHASHVKFPESRSFAHGFPIRGTSEHINNGMVVQATPHKGAVVAPGPLSLSIGPGYEIFAISISPETLSNA